MLDNNTTSVYTSSGIGDALWAIMKILPNINRGINLKTYSRSNYSSKFLYGLHGIEDVDQFSWNKGISIYINECNRLANSEYKLLNETNINKYNDLYFWPNSHVDAGNRIEDYLPSLPTTFRLPWKYDKTKYKNAVNLCKDKTVVLYTSNKKNNIIGTTGRKWSPIKWIELIKGIRSNFEGINIYWVGSSNDTDIIEDIKTHDKEVKFFIDEPAEFLLPLLRECDCFISYQSGISVISVYEAVPTYMLYFNHLDKLRYAWCPPNSIENTFLYNPVLFNDTEILDILQWISNFV